MRRMTFVAAVVTALASTAIAYASIPGPGGVIHGCYQKSGGALRVIDASVTNCAKTETALDWNENGPKGATGAQGPAGPQGSAGSPGAAGPPGVQGPKGSTGAQGSAGPQGLPGTDGATGLVGPTGPKGAPGDPGLKGATGPAGPSSSQLKGATSTIDCGTSSCQAGTELGNTAFCPTGKPVLGGGFAAYDKTTGKIGTNLMVVESEPGFSVWSAFAVFTTTVTSDTYEVDVYVLCGT